MNRLAATRSGARGVASAPLRVAAKQILLKLVQPEMEAAVVVQRLE